MNSVSSPVYYLVQMAQSEIDSLCLICNEHIHDEVNSDVFYRIICALDRINRHLHVVDADMYRAAHK